MFTEPREAPPRTSTFRIIDQEAGHMDLTTTYEGNPTPVQTTAIFVVSDDELRYNVAPSGRERPKEFATHSGDGLTLVHLKRVR
jgi:hypothetical protein